MKYPVNNTNDAFIVIIGAYYKNYRHIEQLKTTIILNYSYTPKHL